MLKKIIAWTLLIALTATASIGATVAYLTSEDSDVNVMTLGNVKIEQLEYERVVENGAWVSTGETDKYGYTPDKIQEFTQAKPLYPAVFADGVIKWDDRNGNQNASGDGSHQQSWGQVGASGSNQLFDDSVKNVQDKFVFVKNTGKSDAYVRTLIAFEQGDIAAENFGNVIMTNSNPTHWSREIVATDVVINDAKFVVFCYTYLGPKSNPTGILAPGAVSYPSLLQVYMRPEATNEDVEAIDGNGNGTYDILVLSQAVQTQGFANAATALNTSFGVANEENVIKWFSGMKAGKMVANDNELRDALAAGEAVILANDITLAAPLTVEQVANINLNGFALGSVGLELKNGGNIQNGVIKSAGNTEDFLMHFLVSGGTLTMDNVDVEITGSMYAGTGYNGSSQSCGIRVENAEVILNDCNVKVHNDTSNVYFVQAWAVDLLNAEFTMNGGSITAKCEKGKAADQTGLDDPAFACALSADGVSTATLNNVAVTATYFGEVFDWQNYSSQFTFNTTDESITADDFILWWSATVTVNHIS